MIKITLCCASSLSSSSCRRWREPSTALAFVSLRSFTGTKISTLAFQPKRAARQPTASSRRLQVHSQLPYEWQEPPLYSYSCSISHFTTRLPDEKVASAEMQNKQWDQPALLGRWLLMHTSSKPTNLDKASSSSQLLPLQTSRTKKTTQTPLDTIEASLILK